MATKSAGRVSIRVLPDSSRFREDLKLSLERIEKTMKATIPAHLEVTRESIRKLKEQLRDLEVRIKVEPYVTQEQLDNLKRKIEETDPNLRVDLDALNAQRRLAFISRDRTVSLFVKVNQASAAAALSTLAALSGTRLVGNVFDSFFRGLKDLDKNIPKIGLIASGIAGISAVAFAGISNVLGLGLAIAQLGQAAVLLPALFVGAGISIGVLIAAFKDMKKVLADLGPGFKRLQDTISARFWRQAEQPIRHLVNTLMPQLSKSLAGVAQSWGKLFGNLAREIERNVTPAELSKMMGNLSRAIDIASNAMKPLVRAFNTLGSFGSQYLPRLGQFIVDLSTKFDNFIQRAAKDGSLERWAETGIQAFKDLGKVLFETGRVFGALARAATTAGGAGFAELASGLKKLADLMNTSNFQTTFATIFAGAHKAMDGLIDGLGELGTGLVSFAPTLATVFSEVGLILEGVGRALGRLFANPALQAGIQNFFSGFKSFIDQLAPAMDPLGRIIGVLATAMGSLAAQAAPLITGVLNLLAPMFEEIWKAIQPLIPDLINLASIVLKELGPPLLTLVKEVLPPLIPIIADLIPLIADLVKAASPVLVDFFKKLGKALEEAGPFINSFAGFAHDLAKALNEFPLALFQWFTSQDGKLDFFETMFRIAIDHPEIVGFFTGLNTALGGFTGKIQAIVDTAEGVGTFFDTIVKLAGVLGLGALATAINGITALLPGWQIFWAGMSTAIAAFQTSGGLVLTTALELLKSKFPIFFNSTNPIWTNFWSGLAPIVTTYLANSRTAAGGGLAGISIQFGLFIAQNAPKFPAFFGLVQTAFRVGMSGMGLAVALGIPGIVQNFITMNARNLAEVTRGFNAIVGIAGVLLARFTAAVQIGVATAVQVVTGMPSQMTLGLFNAVGDFFSAGASLIGAFVQGITSGVNPAVTAAIAVINAVKAVLPHSPAEKGPLSGQGWINLKKSGTAITKQFARGLNSDLSAVQRASSDVVSAVQFNRSSASTTSVRSATGVGSIGGDRALVHIDGDYYGATPEEVANEFDKKLRRSSLASQIGKVGIG